MLKMSDNEMYFCEKCGRRHETDSGVGKRHLKYAKGNGEEGVEDEGELTQEEIEQADDHVMVVALSELPIINREVELQLKSIGILRPVDLANIEPNMLVEKLHDAKIKGIGIKTAEKMIEAARDAVGDLSSTAKSVLQKFQLRKKWENVITTGSDSLDYLIGGNGGGVLMGASYEFFGPGGSGKSELALQITVNAFLPADKGGLVRDDFIPQVLIIDTEDTMKLAVSRFPDMLRKCSETLGHSEEEAAQYADMIEDNVFIRPAGSYTQQESIVIQEHRKMLTGERNYAIVIVDSLVNAFRVGFSKDLSQLAPRQRRINNHIKELKDIVALTSHPDGLDGILVCTNQIQHRPMMFGDGIDNIGGNVVKHNLDIRLKLKQGKGNKIKAKQVDSSFRPGGEAIFTINEWGIGGEDDESSLQSIVSME